MKRKLFFITVFVCTFIFILTVSSSAQCAHSDNWEIKTGDDGILGEWEAMNVCPSCELVLADEFNAPVVTSLGYSCYGESFVQGFRVNIEAVESYERYTAEPLELGVVAGASSLVGYSPVGADGTAHERAVVYSFSGKSAELIDIKIANVPNGSEDKKIVACAYVIFDGEVYYCDNETVDTQVCGISLVEAIDLAENGTMPEGLYEYRALTLEEMSIYVGGYWHSTASPCDTLYTNKSDSVKISATRMFTRAELPSGSYIVIKNGWQARPELWEVNENGAVKRNGTRPYGSNLSAGTYSVDDMWAKNESFEYLAFNVSPSDGFAANGMTPDGISKAFEIYVPAGTRVSRNEVEESEDVSVEGLKLLEWDETNLFANKYWNCTSGSNITGGNTTAKTYYATKRFTPDEIPVGSVIEIRGDLMYRPEYWYSDKKVSSRPGISSVYRFVVTEDFWDTEAYRAFNICEITKGNLTADDWDEIADLFRIYIPVEE